MADKDMHDKYFEGVLQLRNASDEAVGFINSVVEARKGVFISKVVKVGNGFDFYLSSQRFLRSLGKLVYERFGGEMKISSSLHTRDSQTSRDLYRINVFIKLPGFVRGDVVKFKDDVFVVQGFSKNLVSCFDIKKGKKVSLKIGDGFEVLKKVRTTVSKVYPSLEILHPVNFDSVPVNSSKKYELDDEVWVVVVDDSVFLIE